MKYRFASGCALLMEDIALENRSRTVSLVFLVLSTLILAGCPGRTSIEKINREKAARYGVNVADVNQAIETALGGSKITMTVEGRNRFPAFFSSAGEINFRQAVDPQ